MRSFALYLALGCALTLLNTTSCPADDENTAVVEICARVRSLEQLFFLDRNPPKTCRASEQFTLKTLSIESKEIKEITTPLNRRKQTISLQELASHKKRVISLGEGFSGTVPYLISKNVDAYGLDIDDEYRVGKHPFIKASPTHFIFGDATKLSQLPVSQAGFDHIIGQQILCDLGFENALLSISESLRVLKREGTIRHAWGSEDGAHFLFHEDRDKYEGPLFSEDPEKERERIAKLEPYNLNKRIVEFLSRIKAQAEHDGHKIEVSIGKIGNYFPGDKDIRLGSFIMIIKKN